MSDSSYIEKRGAQALLATYLQLTRSAGLAQQLHRARTRSMERRLEKASDDVEHQRLLQRLEAQACQREAIENALTRLQSKVSELASFAEAGLTMDDFRELGLDQVVNAEQVNAAVQRRKASNGRDAATVSAPSSNGLEASRTELTEEDGA